MQITPKHFSTPSRERFSGSCLMPLLATAAGGYCLTSLALAPLFVPKKTQPRINPHDVEQSGMSTLSPRIIPTATDYAILKEMERLLEPAQMERYWCWKTGGWQYYQKTELNGFTIKRIYLSPRNSPPGKPMRLHIGDSEGWTLFSYHPSLFGDQDKMECRLKNPAQQAELLDKLKNMRRQA